MKRLLGIALIVFSVLTYLELTAHAQQFEFCLSADPQHPLEMNTVEVARLFKTVAMEKEVFYCGNDPQVLNQVIDLETFIEIIEAPRAAAGIVGIVEKRVEVARCVKNFLSGAVHCAARDVLLEAGDPSFLANCTPPKPERQPSDPVEMNTVASKDGTVKTIKVEKEVFDCGPFIGDFYLFTEIIEGPAAALPTLRPVEKRFEGILCMKDPKKADIDKCLALKI